MPGGRPKGTPNKHKTSFREQLREYCKQRGVDPHHFMADLLANAEEIVVGIDPEGQAITQAAVNVSIKFNAAKELAQYLEPKLKNIEVSGNPDRPLQHQVVVHNLAEALARAYPQSSTD